MNSQSQEEVVCAVNLHISNTALANCSVGESRVVDTNATFVLICTVGAILGSFDLLECTSIDGIMNNGESVLVSCAVVDYL